MFKEYNPNPIGNNVGDCVIRANVSQDIKSHSTAISQFPKVAQ